MPSGKGPGLRKAVPINQDADDQKKEQDDAPESETAPPDKQD